MTKGHRLFLVTFFPLMGAAMLWILFDTSTPAARVWNTALGLVVAGMSTLAGRAFIVWVQRKGLRQHAETQADGPSARKRGGSRSAVYAAAGLGAGLGPLLLQLIPVGSALLMFLAGSFAFLTGWGLAPDPVHLGGEAARREAGAGHADSRSEEARPPGG